MNVEKKVGKSYKGFPLFDEIGDTELRTRNCATIMTNILEDNFKDKKVSPRGTALIIGYFSKIPEGERGMVGSKFKAFAAERGFVV